MYVTTLFPSAVFPSFLVPAKLDTMAKDGALIKAQQDYNIL
jgi:hypothetical protein